MLYTLAFWTALIQAALFPVLLFFCGKWTLLALRTPGTRKRSQEVVAHTDKPVAVLDPLNCEACGAAMTFGRTGLVCGHCGATQNAPPNYMEALESRRIAMEQLEAASNYLSRASRLTSAPLRWALAILGLWLFATPIVMVIASGTDKRYDGLFARLGSLGNFVFVSIGLWVLLLFFTAGLMSKVQLRLPTVTDWVAIGKAESSTCPACGGGISFGPGQLGALCGFCGVQTLRPQVVWQARELATKDRAAATTTLEAARDAVQSAIDDLIGTPAILLFLLVFLPLLLISPYLLYLAFLEWPAYTLGSILVAGLAVFLARRKR